jgi:hypothetical protein
LPPHILDTLKYRFKSFTKLQRRALWHFVRARLIGWRVGLAIYRLHEALRKHVGLNFFTADIWKHVAIDFHAGAEHLAALFDHFLALDWVIDDIAVFKGQIVFAHDGAHALAPAAGGFQVSYDSRFIHKIDCPQNAINQRFSNLPFAVAMDTFFVDKDARW